METLSNSICTGPTTVYTTDDIAEGMLCARSMIFANFILNILNGYIQFKWL